jgi:hypothetical protein
MTKSLYVFYTNTFINFFDFKLALKYNFVKFFNIYIYIYIYIYIIKTQIHEST